MAPDAPLQQERLCLLFAVHMGLYAADGGFRDEGWRDRKAEALLQRRLDPPARTFGLGQQRRDAFWPHANNGGLDADG